MSSAPLVIKMKSTLFPTMEYIRREAFIYLLSIVSAVALLAVAAGLYASPFGTLVVLYAVGMGAVVFDVWARLTERMARKMAQDAVTRMPSPTPRRFGVDFDPRSFFTDDMFQQEKLDIEKAPRVTIRGYLRPRVTIREYLGWLLRN
jgi:hypothetical protein